MVHYHINELGFIVVLTIKIHDFFSLLWVASMKKLKICMMQLRLVSEIQHMTSSFISIFPYDWGEPVQSHVAQSML